MISPKILRNLELDKKYLIYDSVHEYFLQRWNHGWWISTTFEPNKIMCIFESDLETLLSENRETEHYDFYKNDYQYKGYTNRFRGMSGVGGLNIHGYFSFFELTFFGEYKDKVSIGELKTYKKVMQSSNRRTIATLRDKRKQYE